MKFYPEGKNQELQKSFGAVDEIREAMQSNEIIESRVILCDKEHNLHLDLGVASGIIPREEGALGISEGTVRDIALISKVNKYVCFNIIGIERDIYNNVNAILSRKAVQARCKADFIDKLSQGDVITCAVTHLEKFGAFIDIGAGINALIPIDMLSVSRISHPRERLQTGQVIKAVLRKKEPQKLTFSLKELLGTWQENVNCFSQGETVRGVVRSIEDYGVFVELAPNLAGLAEPCQGLFVGQRVAVYIKSIIPEKMKVKLTIVEAFDKEEFPMTLKYYVEDEHIDSWCYTPPNSTKSISTQF